MSPFFETPGRPCASEFILTGNSWLNEGWTIYLERRIIAAVYGGNAHFDFSAILGWSHLGTFILRPLGKASVLTNSRIEEAIDGFGKDHEFTKLCINHKGVHPDDAFSSVAYEKGFHFVYYLDRVVGRENFDKFIPHYFKKWENKSLDSYEFKATFLDFFSAPEYASLKDAIAAIDWEGRFYNTGLPPKPEFDTSLVDVCYKLAEKWKDQAYVASPEDTASFTGNQKLVFLTALQSFETPLSVAQSSALGKVYGLVDSKNVELKTAYYQIALRARDESTYQGVAELLGQVGRMKFARPLFRSLDKADHALALRTFEKNRDFYHPICRQMLEKDLGLSEAKTAA